MPSDRFLNLSDEKRYRIFLAAVQEFTRVPYDKISINKIIQAADIPRGSFYQYFNDKQDLLEYIMKDFREKMLTTAEETLIANNGDPFDVFPAMMVRVFEIAEQFYNPDFFRNVFSCISATNLQDFDFFNIETDEIRERFAHLVNYPSFTQAPVSMRNDIIDILTVLLHNAVGRKFIDNSTIEDSLEEFKRKINIIRNCVQLKGANQ